MRPPARPAIQAAATWVARSGTDRRFPSARAERTLLPAKEEGERSERGQRREAGDDELQDPVGIRAEGDQLEPRPAQVVCGHHHMRAEVDLRRLAAEGISGPPFREEELDGLA